MALVKQPKTVLIAVDESEHSRYALEWALDHLLGPQRGDNKVILFHAKPLPSSYAGPGYILPAESFIMIEKAQDREISSFLTEAGKICRERNITFETEVVVGDARNAICEATKKQNVDYLVMGSHGYGVIKRVVLGSVSDYCVHHAKCPVVVVKKPHAASHS